MSATDLHVVVVVPAFNAGDTTRGIESARALREHATRRGRTARIEFWCPRTTRMYDDAIRRAGFPVRILEAGFTDEMVEAVMTADHRGTEFLADADMAAGLLDLLLAELRDAAPDFVLYGFLPPVGVAAQILGLASACYSPFPADPPWVRRHFLTDVPDELAAGPLAAMPSGMRRTLARGLSAAVPMTGFFRQPTTVAAGKARGWRTAEPNLFGMLGADAQIVNDLPSFYSGQSIRSSIHLAGPLYSTPGDAEVPADIRAWFTQAQPGRRIFLAMGSSGEKRYLLDAIEAVSRLDAATVAVVPPHVATLAQARARLAGPGRVLLTDAFVPAAAVNALADAAVIHGGQGTVQTAVTAGTPVVGVGMQWEQANNLDRLVAAGSGIRLRRGAWSPDAVEAAVGRILTEPSFAAAAHRLQRDALAVDGFATTGEILYDTATRNAS